MRLANQGETADRITLEMLLVLVMALSPKTTGMSQQLEERLGMGRGADGSEGFEADDGTFDSKFEDGKEEEFFNTPFKKCNHCHHEFYDHEYHQYHI